jgi:hypothetical protein
MVTFSLEAKKKTKMPASQKTQVTKQHKAAVKSVARSHKAPKARKLKHTQKVN